MRPPVAHPAFLPSAALVSALLLTGCGMGPRPAASPTQGVSLQGRVHGGQQPIAGARVYLFTADRGGFGNSSDSLLTTATSDSIGSYVISDALGNFTLTGDYTCNSGNQVYVLALGGNAGGGANSAIGLMAVLGTCPDAGNFSSTPFIEVNEVSTIAAAYALAPFSVDALHIANDAGTENSTSTAADLGMANAFANASNLVDLGSGVALLNTPAGNGTVPQATINTLANILAACVNSADQESSAQPSGNQPRVTAALRRNDVPYSYPCQGLFMTALANGTSGASPTDTASAAINIAHNPTANVDLLYSSIGAQPPFLPTLPTEPSDLSLQLYFTGGGITDVNYVAIDAFGNVWLSDDTSLDELTSLGVPLSPPTGFGAGSLSSPGPLAIDANNNAWTLTSAGEASSISEVSSTGPFLTTTDASGYAGSLAIDPTGNIWVANNAGSYNDTLDEFDYTGAFLANYSGGLSTPSFIAIDSASRLWIPNQGANNVSEFSPAGLPGTSSPFVTGAAVPPVQAALDSSGLIWLINQDGSISGIDGLGDTFPGVSAPRENAVGVALTLDGLGHFWTIAYTPIDIGIIVNSYALIGYSAQGSEFLVQPFGYTPQSLAIDSSGNLWLPEQSKVVEYVGLAGPVITPITVAATKVATLP